MTANHRTIGMALGLGAAEMALVVFGVRTLDLTAVLGVHVAASVAACLWTVAARSSRSRYGALLCLSTAAFGPFGPPGVLLAMALERLHAPRARDVAAWHDALFPPGHQDERWALWRHVGQRAADRPRAAHVTPFLDVLAFGSVAQRRSALALISQQFRPAFAPALRAALRDEHNAIRVQAAATLAQIEDAFLKRLVRLDAALRASPDDAEVVLALAHHYDDQAFAGLLDPSRERECRVRATELYERYLRQRPGDQATEFRLARLQLRRGRAADAEPRFRRLAGQGHPTAHLWLMEALFASRRYAELRAVAAEGPASLDALVPEAASTRDLWSGRSIAA